MSEIKYEIRPNITLDGDIQLVELKSFGDEPLKEFQAGVIKTKDKAIIASLKKLGWATPEENAALKERVAELKGAIGLAISELDDEVPYALVLTAKGYLKQALKKEEVE